jgi:hypothetical protein
MLLYALCLNPPINILNQTLPGKTIGRQTRNTSVTAYADDVTVFLTSPADFPKLREAIISYENSSGAKINLPKSKVLALGSWDKSINILNIPYHDKASILALQILETVQRSTEASWMQTTALKRTKAQDDYSRMLTFDKKIRYIHEHL